MLYMVSVSSKKNMGFLLCQWVYTKSETKLHAFFTDPQPYLNKSIELVPYLPRAIFPRAKP
ncbi:hypothetical protein HMPREF1640_13660 [Prevotella sp. S7-1-8]|nr:hypothetical protein HMPREF1640_13660 [Prevotella sp. S7-1-8]